MTKKEMAALIAKEAGLSLKTATAGMNAVVDILIDRIGRGETVDVNGFGRFEVVVGPERRGRNPQTGETISFPPIRTLEFEPAEPLVALLDDDDQMPGPVETAVPATSVESVAVSHGDGNAGAEAVRRWYKTYWLGC